MLDPLNDNLFHERDDVEETKRSAANLEEILDETYDELKAYLLCRIEGGQNQLQMVTDKRNAILQANRVPKPLWRSLTTSCTRSPWTSGPTAHN